MANHYFKFKQFTVFHDLCAMKVGTDGVLLGAWCNIEFKKRILDIGAGTGLISLMLAQRNSDALIDAVEIDPDASRQASVNFEASPWANRLNLWQGDFAEYASPQGVKYDLIVSNPPFFENSLKTDCQKRAKARHTDSLPFESLIAKGASLLAQNGTFALIYPIEADLRIHEIASSHGLVCCRRTVVKGTPVAAPKRILAEYRFSSLQSEIQNEELTIELARHTYTPEYIALTRAFYLKME